MKKILKIFAGVLLVCLITSCSFLSGLDAPENFQVYACGRKLTFTWDEVSGADYYEITTTGGKVKWENEEVRGTKLVLDNMSNLLNWTEYKFTVVPVKSNGIKGPASDSVKVYIPYGFEHNTMLFEKKNFSKSKDGGVEFTWDNIKTAPYNGKVEHIGVQGITYAVYRQEGREYLGSFKESEDKKILIADNIVPSNDYADEKLSYIDTDIEVGKVYQYYVLPYSTYYPWESDSYITPGLNGIDIKYVVIKE